MSDKRLIYFAAGVGSVVGSYIPVLWGAGELSVISVIFGALGGFIGIYFAYRWLH